MIVCEICRKLLDSERLVKIDNFPEADAWICLDCIQETKFHVTDAYRSWKCKKCDNFLDPIEQRVTLSIIYGTNVAGNYVPKSIKRTNIRLCKVCKEEL